MKEKFTLHPQLEKDTLKISDLDLCQLRLHRNCENPWIILVPRVPKIRELMDLAPSERALLNKEIEITSTLLSEIFKPYKINLGALGNMVDQFHFHVIARYKGDKGWPGPLWGKPLFKNENVSETWLVRLRASLNQR